MVNSERLKQLKMRSSASPSTDKGTAQGKTSSKRPRSPSALDVDKEKTQQIVIANQGGSSNAVEKTPVSKNKRSKQKHDHASSGLEERAKSQLKRSKGETPQRRSLSIWDLFVLAIVPIG